MKKLITNIAIIITIILTSVNYSVGQQAQLYGQNLVKLVDLYDDGTYGISPNDRPVYKTDTLYTIDNTLTFKYVNVLHEIQFENVKLVVENNTLYKIINDSTGQLYSYLRKNIDGTLSVNEIEVSNLNVYPNPVIDVLNISFDSNENVDVIVMDMSGRIVHNEPSSTLISGINLSDQPSGMYLVKIGNQTQRIIKQ